MKDVGDAVLAGCSPPFLGRERAAVDVDVGPERRSPRYHETCLALESVKENNAAVSMKVNREVYGCACPSSKISKKRVVSRCAWRNSRRSSSL